MLVRCSRTVQLRRGRSAAGRHHSANDYALGCDFAFRARSFSHRFFLKLPDQMDHIKPSSGERPVHTCAPALGVATLRRVSQRNLDWNHRDRPYGSARACGFASLGDRNPAFPNFGSAWQSTGAGNPPFPPAFTLRRQPARSLPCNSPPTHLRTDVSPAHLSGGETLTQPRPAGHAPLFSPGPTCRRGPHAPRAASLARLRNRAFRRGRESSDPAALNLRGPRSRTAPTARATDARRATGSARRIDAPV